MLDQINWNKFQRTQRQSSFLKGCKLKVWTRRTIHQAVTSASGSWDSGIRLSKLCQAIPTPTKKNNNDDGEYWQRLIESQGSFDDICRLRRCLQEWYQRVRQLHFWDGLRIRHQWQVTQKLTENWKVRNPNDSDYHSATRPVPAPGPCIASRPRWTRPRTSQAARFTRSATLRRAEPKKPKTSRFRIGEEPWFRSL